MSMAKAPYTKPPLTFHDQLSLLESRGLVVEHMERDIALSYLSVISYYRLSAYFLPYQIAKDQFTPGTTFRQIIDTYSFDRELRLLVFDCIERIEVAIRTQFIYQMAIQYGDSHWQDRNDLFKSGTNKKTGKVIDPFAAFQDIIAKAKNAGTPEVYIRHYMDRYDFPDNPPSWMCFELLTIGELSHLYSGLAHNDDKKRISDFFGLTPRLLSSWLHALTYVRNICAHHGRLWNKDLAIEPAIPKSSIAPWVGSAFLNNKRTFYFLCLLKYMLSKANPQSSMRQKLEALFQKFTHVPVKYLGIPSDGKGNLLIWQDEPLWK